MPKVSDQHLSKRQDQILDAAVVCYAQNGFHATGMADIIRESGLSAGSVYRYYKSKDELIAAIITRLLFGLHARLQVSSAGANTHAELMDAALTAAQQTFSGSQLQYARLLPQVWTEALRNPGVAQHVQQSYGVILGHLRGRVAQMQAGGTLGADLNPAGVAHVTLAAVQGFMLQKLILGDDLDEPSYLSAARRMFEAGPQHQ